MRRAVAKIVLASGSPRRQELLARIGIEEAERLILSDELLCRKDEILAKVL